tara:strand:+ start:33 stop:1763 length:1731 start_codon:yes stop_codon:yes gene_type:complete
MPKQIHKIIEFHGGLNNNTDPRDITEREITASTDIMVDEIGKIRLSGSNVAHTTAPIIPDTAYGSVTPVQVTGSGLFSFSHDRQGAEGGFAYSDGASTVSETTDNYLAFYDDSAGTGNVGPGIFMYSLSEDDWKDKWEDTDAPVIQFLGKTTSGIARPSFFSVDGALRVSSGEFESYASGSLINDGSHFLSTDTTLTVDNGAHFLVGNYLKINDEIIYVVSKSTHDLTVIRGMFGTKVIQHNDNSIINILNMNQWYDYLNNKLFQTSNGISSYENNKWYNDVQHLKSLNELGITLELHDAQTTSPAAAQINAINKIIVAHWFTTTDSDVGFWNGTYWIGMTPIYQGNQEGPISNVGTSPLIINEEILNIQLYITHPDLDDSSIVEADGHPLIDERIIGLKLYTKQYTSDEWYLLQEFDLLEGGEHGWETYNSDAGATVNSGGGNTLTGYWKTTSTADSLSVAAPTATASYDGEAESNTCTVTLNLNESKGVGRVGILRLNGFDNTPLYEEVDLNSTSSQAKVFNVINPSPGTHKFVVELLDENFNIMRRAEIEQAISDSGVDASPTGGTVSYSGSS